MAMSFAREFSRALLRRPTRPVVGAKRKLQQGYVKLRPKWEYQSSRRWSNSYEAHSGERRLIAPQQVHEGVKFGMPVKLRTSHTAGAGRDAAV